MARCYSHGLAMRAILRSFLAVAALAMALSGCRHRPPVTPRPLFPMTAIWTRPVPATVEGPLAADTVSVFVATRDGAVRALDVQTGRPRWRVDDRPGVVAAGGGLVSVRNEDGTVWAMDSATGSDRWKAASGVRGRLPAVLYKDAVVVAGEGLVVLEAATGQPRWSDAEARATSAPMAWGP